MADLKNVFTPKEVNSFILKIQELIRRIDNRSFFRFSFELDPEEKKFVLTTRSYYNFSLKDENNKFISYKFYGESTVVATNNFINFFNGKGKGEIKSIKEGYNFNVEFYWNSDSNEWIIERYPKDDFYE